LNYVLLTQLSTNISFNFLTTCTIQSTSKTTCNKGLRTLHGSLENQ